MERKLARAQGHRTEDETRALAERIEGLTAALQAATTEHAMLVDQASLWEGGPSPCVRAARSCKCWACTSGRRQVRAQHRAPPYATHTGQGRRCGPAGQPPDA